MDVNGKSPFATWFKKLNVHAAAKVSTELYRLEMGNFSNVKSLKGRLFEYKIHFGQGYRVYFGQEDDSLVLLLGGGIKKQQTKDITAAKAHWLNYNMDK